MRWLPPLPEPLQDVVLPLADRSAAALTDALVSGDTPPVRQCLKEALEADPPFTLWVLVNLHWQNSVPPSASELVDHWFAHGLSELQWSPTAQFDVSPATAEQFARYSARDVAVAQGVARAEQDSSKREQLLIAQLLQSAPEWIKRCGGATDAVQVLPAWIRQPSDTVSPDMLATEQYAYDWQIETVPLVQILPQLASKFGRLTQLEQKFSREVEDAKLQALYTLAAGAGHEINNPLGSIAGRAQLLIRDESDPERRRTLAKINSQAFRAHEMISDMMLFARPPQPVREQIDLKTIVNDVVDSLSEVAAERNTTFHQSTPGEPVTLDADPTQLTVALRAMCVNAIEAIGSGGRVELKIAWVDREIGKTAEISVHDSGPGISPEQRNHIFDPFYSGREAGRGLGFGLSKSWRIVKNHGGEIDVESTPGGAVFTIRLPAA